MSDIQDYIDYIIKKHETLPTNPPIHIDGYRLELQTPETIKLFGSTKKFINKTKNEENFPNLEVFETVLVQYNLVDNQYQQKS